MGRALWEITNATQRSLNICLYERCIHKTIEKFCSEHQHLDKWVLETEPKVNAALNQTFMTLFT